VDFSAFLSQTGTEFTQFPFKSTGTADKKIGPLPLAYMMADHILGNVTLFPSPFPVPGYNIDYVKP
jgi:hypothetical protein